MPAISEDERRGPELGDVNVDPEIDKGQYQRWIEYYRQEAASYRFHFSSDHTKELELRESPVLLYTNPVGSRGLTHGAVFVWTYQGRSEVVGAIWSHANTPGPNQRTVSHEFHSLSAEPVVAERSGEVVWSTTQPSVQWITPDEVPRPAPSTFGRLTQMRNLAKELNVARVDPKDESKEQLRLLPQPLYRYERGSSAASDGAVFAYCVVWDPDLFLVIESRETDGGPTWKYAPVRFTHLTLTVHHRQKEVWRDARDSKLHRDPAMGYKLFYGVSVQSEVIESE
ncbi:MAG: hypothetical protein O3C40_33895 [Planctomycetota bacterium]|nr:hypothetical protein [Planctomycetota bacterium]